MSVIHLDPERVNAMIQKLTTSRLDFEQGVDRFKKIRTKIQLNWYGDKASETFGTALNKTLKQLTASTQQINDLERNLRSEVDQWLEADARFGGSQSGAGAVPPGTATPAPTLTVEQLQQQICGPLSGAEQDRCLMIWSSPPKNAEQLAFMIQNLPEKLPIVIMDIGNGEYLVLLRGSTTSIEEGSGLGSAVESMFGNSSYQNSVVAALRDANLPPSAKLHFAGHSQGGMVAQNLAVDRRVLNHFEVETVTMFGSPDTFMPNNPNVKYVSFEAEGDIIPQIDEIYEKYILREDTPVLNDVGNQAEVHVIPKTERFKILDPVAPHRVYDDEGLLSGYDIPFEAEAWNPIAQEDADISTLGPIIYDFVGLDDLGRILDGLGVI